MALVLIISLIIKFSAAQPDRIDVRFDSACFNQDTCGVLFNVHEDMPGPVYLYIHYKNFYVNHRNVVQSISSTQLTGTDINDDSQKKESCDPFKLNSDVSTITTSYQGTTLVNDEVLSPCGIYPVLVPRDTFTLTLKGSSSDSSALTAQPADTNIVISSDKDLVWDGLKGVKYNQ